MVLKFLRAYFLRRKPFLSGRFLSIFLGNVMSNFENFDYLIINDGGFHRLYVA